MRAAKKLLETSYRPTLLSLHALLGQGEKPRLSMHVQHQLDILSQQENYIDAAIQVINGAQEKGWEVELTNKSLREVFEDAEEDHQQAIQEAEVNGLTHLFTVIEKEPKPPWWKVCIVALLGVVQTGAGILITACTAGSLGPALIQEGVSDLMTAAKAAIGKGFSWAEWKLQKAIRLAVSIASAGWNLVKKGIKAIGKAAKQGQDVGKAVKQGQDVGKIVKQGQDVGKTIKQGIQDVGKTFKNVGSLGSDIGKDGLKAATKYAGLAFGKGILKEGLNVLADYAADNALISNVENKIAEEVKNTITRFLNDNQLVQKALALDNQYKNNHWQEVFIREGLELLNHKRSEWSYALGEIAKGVASNQIPGARKLIQRASMAKALEKIVTFTKNFLKKFNNKIEQHQKEIALQEQAASPQAQYYVVQACVEGFGCDAEDESQVKAIPVHQVRAGSQHTSKEPSSSTPLREQYCDPSTQEKICRVLSNRITGQLTHTIQSELVRPVTGSVVNWGVEEITKEATKKVSEDMENYRTKRRVHNLADAIAKIKGKKAKQPAEADKVAEEQLQASASKEAASKAPPSSEEAPKHQDTQADPSEEAPKHQDAQAGPSKINPVVSPLPSAKNVPVPCMRGVVAAQIAATPAHHLVVQRIKNARKVRSRKTGG